MVQIIHPSSRICTVRLPSTNVPYFLMENGDYPYGWNAYVAGRAQGSIDSKGEEVAVGRRLSENSIRNLYFDVGNILGWAEYAPAHPVQGSIAHNALKGWFLDQLYMDCLISGYWTQEFWASGLTISLNSNTIERRLREGRAGLRWMSSQGLIPKSYCVDDTLDIRERSKRAAIESFETLIPLETRSLEVKYGKKSKPGEYEPYSINTLQKFFRFIEDEATLIALIVIITHGLRLKEVEENILLPGIVFRRPKRYDSFSEPTYPQKPYLLKFSGRADHMTGVIPSFDDAFESDEIARSRCVYYVLGKGPKARRIRLMPWVARLFWRYAHGERIQILNDAGIALADQPAQLLLNKNGRPLTADRIYRTTASASKKLGLTVPITPHPLRHTFACLFLESAILELAKADGHQGKRLSIAQITYYGNQAIIVLKKQLGHKLYATTAIYLEKLASGIVQMQLVEMFEQLATEVVKRGA